MTTTSFSLMSDNNSLDQFAHQYEEKQKKKKRQNTFNGNVQSNKSHKFIKGLLYNPESMMRMRNDMIHTSLVINYISHIKTRNRTYRESI